MTTELTGLVDVLKEQTAAISALATAQNKSSYSADAGTYTELHGNGSLFGSNPIERDVITAHMRPKGIAGMLPLLPNVVEHPIFALLTGYSADEGSEPSNPCDPAPSGYMKACNQTAQFGRVARETQTIEIDKVMLRKNRGDFTDLMLRGQVLGMNGLSPASLNSNDILNIVTKSEMVQVGVRFERKLSQQIWQGAPANNNAGGGYKEFPGLDLQIATGHVDYDSNTACPAVDSDVKNFGYNLVGGTGNDIVEYLSMLEFYLRNNAESMGLDPVTWVIVMRPELWQELSAVWPCLYLTNRCGDNNGNSVSVINDNVNVQTRDAMRNGKYIDINGNRYVVVTDDGIFEHTNVNNGNVGLGQYASSIYMVPLTINGNFPVTYREHVDYRAASSDIALLNGKERFWTDDGVYFWVVEQDYWCYKLQAKTEQRVVLRTPQLAGRIDNVMYSPLQHLRSPYPEDPYFVNGGVSLRSDEDFYAVWK